MVRLAIDFENQSREWWDNGGQDLWDSIIEGFENNAVLLDESLAESWIAHAKQIPGWDNGHPYSPNPVVLQAVDDDEVL